MKLEAVAKEMHELLLDCKQMLQVQRLNRIVDNQGMENDISNVLSDYRQLHQAPTLNSPDAN